MMTLSIRTVLPALALLVITGACQPPSEEPAAGNLSGRPDLEAMTGAERMERLVGILAADSMEGRATGSVGAERAARFIAEELASYGVEPAFETGFSQPIPLRRILRPDGRERLVVASAEDPPEVAEVPEALTDANIVGVIRGGDRTLAEEAVILGAHFDHVGVGRSVDGDSIYNGADDDASGVAVVLEVARLMARSEPPGRTVVVLLTTGEEMGLLGTRFYIENPAVPIERTVADLQVEMVGRPDSLAGGVGRAWLTGFERTTLGAALAEAGVPIVPDPRPDQRFFFRSDNIAFARLGIPAHTLSSFNLHDDYHRPSDEARFLDYEHMAAVTEATVEAVRILADGPPPDWLPGGRPEGRNGGGP